MASKLSTSEFRVNRAIAPPGMKAMGSNDLDFETMKGMAAIILIMRFEVIASALNVIESNID